MMQPYFGRKPNLYDSKVIIKNGEIKLVKKHYTVQVIKSNTGTKVVKKYIDADLACAKVK